MKNISKKVLIACCAALCATTCIAGIASSEVKADNKYAYTNALLKSNSVLLKDSYAHGEKTGLLLSSPVKGGVASYRDTVSGKFTAEFDFAGENTEVVFSFKDREQYTQFNVRVNLVGGEVSAYVEYDGGKGGIYYADGVAIGQTEERNLNNLFTRMPAGNSVSLSFDPSSMTVRMGDYLVWDLSKEKNDGSSIAQGITGFGYYSVSVVLDKSENNGGIVLYELLGESLSYKYLRHDLAAPAIYADYTMNGIRGQSYALPKPHVYDVQCGNLAETGVNVKITDPDKTVVFEGAWTKNSGFTPTVAGEYLAVYTAEDDAGNKGEQRFTFSVLENAPKAAFDLGHTFSTTEFGVGSVIEIPTAKVSYGMLNMESSQYAECYLTVNGAPITNICGRKANQKYKIELPVEGVYELSYRYVKGSVELSSDVIRITATKELPALSDVSLSRTMYVGAKINVPPASFILKGEKKEASIQIISPDGATLSAANNAQFTFDKAGLYTMVYSVEFNGTRYEEKKEIVVSYSPNSLFKDNLGVDAKFSYFPYDPSINGLVVSIKDEERAEFEQAVNFADYDSQKPFLELLSISKSSTVHNVREYLITLTDVHDYNNSIVIRINARTNNEKSWVSCAAKGGATLGWNGSAYVNGLLNGVNYGGTEINHSFRSINNIGFENQTIKLYFDYANRQIFVDKGGVRTMVADLDEHAFVSASGASFDGFSTGEAYIGIAYTDFSYRELGTFDHGYYMGVHDVMVLQCAGYDFRSGSTVDYIPPEIEVDVKSDLPLAVVNRAFQVFDAYALDGIDGQVEVSYAVYKGNDRTNPLPIVGGEFTPTESGPYSIVYRAMDGMKNVAEKTIVIDAVDSVPGFTIALTNGNADDEGTIGQKISFRSYQTSGGVGYATVEIEVELNGEKIEVEGNSMTIQSVGEYLITYKARDYIGNTSTVSYTVHVDALAKPLFDTTPVAAYVIEEGSRYTLPVVTATDYSDASDVKKAQVQVYVSENGGAYQACGETYTPSADLAHGAKIDFKYVATGQQGSEEKTTTSYYSKINKTNGSIDMATYFVLDGASVALDGDAQINFSRTGVATWGKALIADGFTAGLNFANSSDVKVVLVDKWNANEKIVVSVKKIDAKNFSVSVGGNEAITMDLTSNVDFKFSGQENRLSLGSLQSEVKTFANGEPFTGFSSGFVYMILEASAGNNVAMKKLFGQNINIVKKDLIAPNIAISEALSSYVIQNSKYTLPTAIASDVLADIQDCVRVSVKKADGSFMKDVNGVAVDKLDASKAYTLLFNEAGKYSITYTVSDTSGAKEARLNQNLTVAPYGVSMIDLKVSAPKVEGNVIRLSKAEVDKDVSVYVSVLNANGAAMPLSETQDSCSVKNGKYVVRYTAYDAKGNYTVKTFEVEVG